MSPLGQVATLLGRSPVGNDVDSKVLILTANVEMDPSIHAEIELPAMMQNPELCAEKSMPELIKKKETLCVSSGRC